MTWLCFNVPAPEGNQNAVKAKRWQQAIDRALAKKSKVAGIEELDRLAEKFLEEVEAEGLDGYKELADRIDGKATQAVTGADGGPIQVEIVRFANPDTP